MLGGRPANTDIRLPVVVGTFAGALLLESSAPAGALLTVSGQSGANTRNVDSQGLDTLADVITDVDTPRPPERQAFWTDVFQALGHAQPREGDAASRSYFFNSLTIAVMVCLASPKSMTQLGR